MDTATVLSFEEKRRERYAETRKQEAQEDARILKALRTLRSSSLMGVYILEHLVRLCCLEPNLDVPAKYAGQLMGFGLMTRDGKIPERVHDVVKYGGDTDFKLVRKVILDHLNFR